VSNAVPEIERRATQAELITLFDTLARLGRTAIKLSNEIYDIHHILAISGRYAVPEDYSILLEPYMDETPPVVERWDDQQERYTQHGVKNSELENRAGTGLRRNHKGDWAFVGKSMQFDRDRELLYIYSPDEKFRVVLDNGTRTSIQRDEPISSHWPIEES
jgi:hypothetical protein